MNTLTSLNLTANSARFCALWRRNLIQGVTDDSEQLYQQLITAYNEEQRIYHTQHHIEDCLVLFEKIKHKLQHADAVELAIWYHDAIYKIGARDNEQLSADLFMQLSDGVQDDEMRNRVYQLILATLHCDTVLLDSDTKYMVDIDLSSFGMEWEKFIEDSDNVRMEMQHIPDEEFYPKQCEFQQFLLKRKRFYQSDYFYQHYEQQARKNLADYFMLVQKKTGRNCSPN